MRPSAELAAWTSELRAVNEALWEVEDALRVCEREEDFGVRFIALARSVYRHNDRRAALKAAISERLGARFQEQKSYQGFERFQRAITELSPEKSGSRG